MTLVSRSQKYLRQNVDVEQAGTKVKSKIKHNASCKHDLMNFHRLNKKNIDSMIAGIAAKQTCLLYHTDRNGYIYKI